MHDSSSAVAVRVVSGVTGNALSSMKHKCKETPCQKCLRELLDGAAKWMDVPLIHITPVDDSREHLEEGQSCPCGPTVELLPDGSIMVSHNSWDGREWSEGGNPNLN